MAKIDIVDYLTEKLTEATEIPFVRDAWVNKAPDEYGVVELGDAVAEQWADGKLIDAVYQVTATMFVTGARDDWPETVQAALEAAEAEDGFTETHTVSREFDINTGKVRWVWSMRIYGPLIVGEDDDGQTGG